MFVVQGALGAGFMLDMSQEQDWDLAPGGRPQGRHQSQEAHQQLTVREAGSAVVQSLGLWVRQNLDQNPVGAAAQAWAAHILRGEIPPL